MKLTPAEMDVALRSYEGLIFSTAQRLIRSGVEAEMEDIQQILRIKVWKGIVAYNPDKARGMTRDRYCFMVLRDQAKDIAKKKRRGELHIEDVAPATQFDDDGYAPRDKFEQRYLSSDSDQEYAAVEDDLPNLPNTLTDRERVVLDLMRDGYRQTEIGPILNITKRDVESSVRGIRAKLADWKPSGGDAGLGNVLRDDLLPQPVEVLGSGD